MLRTEKLCKTYGLNGSSVHAISNLDLHVPRGTCLLIQGPSGSGKSTLLNLLGCLTHPTSGRVFIDGREVSHLPDQFLTAIRREKIGFVFQSFNLLHGHSVLDNVSMPLLPLGMGLEARRERAMSLLRRVNLEHRASFQVNRLSGGEQQRVAVARALVNDPAILIADEPNSNIDRHNSRLVLELFHEFKKEGRTLVISSHDPSFEGNELIDEILTLGEFA
jgi:putative ABC transport system ATP-binding protein